MRSLAIIAILVVPAAAQPPTQIVGKLTDTAGRPLESATVTAGAATAMSNANGIYRLVVPGPGNYDVNFTYADAAATRTVAVESIATLDTKLDVDSDAVIVIHDPRPMIVRPKPANKYEHRIIPPYSDAAIEHDAWENAWLLLDVDANGTVTRLKFLHEPGHDLKDVATKHAFGLKFEPGRDAQNRPMPALVLWHFEWPAYWWLVQMEGVTTALTTQIYSASPPCKGSGPLYMSSMHRTYRDCSGPDVAKGLTAKWITHAE
jgi:hypothetical protein